MEYIKVNKHTDVFRMRFTIRNLKLSFFLFLKCTVSIKIVGLMNLN